MSEGAGSAPREGQVFSPRAVSAAIAVDASRHSRAVRFLRIALPGAALAIVAAVAIYASGQRGEPARMTFTLSEIAALENDLEMTGIRLFGRDENERPYTITADRLRQTGGRNARSAKLEKIVADLGIDGGGKLHIEAGAGLYDDDARTLRLTGGVSFRSPDGYALTTDAATADLDAGTVVSDGPVTGKGPFGDFSGGKMTADRATGQVVLTDGVRTLFAPPPKQETGAAPAPGGTP